MRHFMDICVCSKTKYLFPESVSDSILEFSEGSLLMLSLKEAVCPVYILIELSCFTFEQLSELKHLYPSLPVAVLAPQISPENYETICLLSPFRLVDPSVLPLNDFALLANLNECACSMRIDFLRSGLQMVLLSETDKGQESDGYPQNQSYYQAFSSGMRLQPA